MPNRRKVIKSIATVAGLSVLSRLAAGGPGAEAKSLGIALVGLGNYATKQLGPALRQTKFCHLSAIVTGTAEKATTWQQEYGISAEHTYDYDGFDAIAEDDAIDIVYIVLPNFMHTEFTLRALQAGKHVICEKPMAMNADECRTMIAAAKAANKKLQIGYRLFYDPHHLRLKEQSEGSFKGRKRLIEASLGFDMARPGMWRIDPEMGGGGALMDLGPYTIQAARRAVGENPIAVRAQGYVDDPELYKGIYGTYSWQLVFPDGSLCNTTTSFSGYVDRLHVSRGNQFLELAPAFSANAATSLRSWEGTEKLEVPEFQQTTQMDAFAQNILGNSPVLASGEEGLTDMIIVDAIKTSLASGKEELIQYG